VAAIYRQTIKPCDFHFFQLPVNPSISFGKPSPLFEPTAPSTCCTCFQQEHCTKPQHLQFLVPWPKTQSQAWDQVALVNGGLQLPQTSTSSETSPARACLASMEMPCSAIVCRMHRLIFTVSPIFTLLVLLQACSPSLSGISTFARCTRRRIPALQVEGPRLPIPCPLVRRRRRFTRRPLQILFR